MTRVGLNPRLPVIGLYPVVGLRWSSWCEKVVALEQVLCSSLRAWIGSPLYSVSVDAMCSSRMA